MAASAEPIVPTTRRLLHSLVDGPEAMLRETTIDDVMAAMTTISNLDPATMQLLIWDELEALERRQEFLLVLNFITGPIADSRRRAVRSAAPHRAEAFEAMLVRTSNWYRQAVEKLDRRIALIRTSHRVIDEHEGTLRALAK